MQTESGCWTSAPDPYLTPYRQLWCKFFVFFKF